MITHDQCRAARSLIRMKQVELADAAGLSKQTVVDFERGARTPHRNNMAMIQSALEAAGIEFIPENGGGVGVRFRERSG